MSYSVQNLVFPKQDFSKEKLPLLVSGKLHWSIISIGVALRLIQYFLNRSLWIDEAFLALNITERSLPELLFQPLAYNQAAPIGFLLLEKLVTQGLGSSEYALRFVPLIAGIASLFLFYAVAKWFSRSLTVTIALALFAISDRLIYFSSELKQYSSDVAIALLLFWAITRFEARMTVLSSILVGILGAIAIWFSHPAVFVLAELGSILAIENFIHQQWLKLSKIAAACSLWAVSFVSFYWISLKPLTQNEVLSDSWGSKGTFMPLPPLSLSDFRWFIDTFFEVFRNPLGFYLAGIAALAFMIGLTTSFAKKRKKVLWLISPILVTLIASGLNKYPFREQLLLFIIPFVLLLIAEGVQETITQTQQKISIISISLIILLFIHPVCSAALNLVNPNNAQHPFQRVREDIKPVLAYLNQQWQKGDITYLYYASQYQFKYYANRFGFDLQPEGKTVQNAPPGTWFEPALSSYPPELIVGHYFRKNLTDLNDEIARLIGHDRVWLVFSHVHDRRSALDEEDLFLFRLDSIGKRLDAFQALEASAYLYDLSNSAKATQSS